MDYSEILKNARECSGPYCKACPVCNGMACRTQVPGPGGKGTAATMLRNYQKWQEVCINMDTICENAPIDTTFTLFGRKFAAPIFAAPVGAMKLHYGDKYDDLTYNDLLVSSCAQAGIAAFTGDGTNPAVVEGAVKAVQGWVDCFERCELAETVFAGGVNDVGDIAGHPALEQARRMGMGI